LSAILVSSPLSVCATGRPFFWRSYIRFDALTDAFATLIDARKLSEAERLVSIAALKEASARVNGEYEKFRKEQGLCG
jgi:hypothetical protein